MILAKGTGIADLGKCAARPAMAGGNFSSRKQTEAPPPEGRCVHIWRRARWSALGPVQTVDQDAQQESGGGEGGAPQRKSKPATNTTTRQKATETAPAPQNVEMGPVETPTCHNDPQPQLGMHFCVQNPGVYLVGPPGLKTRAHRTMPGQDSPHCGTKKDAAVFRIAPAAEPHTSVLRTGP